MSGAPLRDLVQTADEVRATASGLAKRARMAAYLRTLPPDDAALAASYLAGEIPGGKLNVGWRALSRMVAAPLGAQRSLFAAETGGEVTLGDVDRCFDRLRDVTGAGAEEGRRRILGELLARARDAERAFILRLVGGELRQGALRSMVIDALAEAYEAPGETLRRAVMVSGDFGEVVRALAARGVPALAEFELAPLAPVQPMLAVTASSAAEALAALGGEAAVEWKLDGVRVQLHRAGEEVRVFSRRLRDVTPSFPELVDFARGLDATRFILDGEVVGRDAEGRPVPFQDLVGAVFRDPENEEGSGDRTVAIESLFFDLLYLDGDVTVDRPYRERRRRLDELVPEASRMPHRVVASPEEAEGAYEEALWLRHEGVIFKDLDAPYRAGRRGAHWQKLKPAVTVDLVILAAEWGSGRRRGRLSNLHLGARVPDAPEDAPDGFVMLGKTFKGLTDAMLDELTRELPKIETRRDRSTVYVEPRRVVEIAFDGLQRSRRYDSGLALRFARVKRFRPDKSAAEATTIDEIRRIHRARSR